MALKQVTAQPDENLFSVSLRITRQLLAIAFDRALQRRLGRVPSPTLVNKAVSKLAHDEANPSPFVQHAIRVQEQLAHLHARLQRAQEPRDHAISPIQDTPTMPLTRAQKRSASHDDDTHPAQETKRKRLDNPGPSQPHSNTPPSISHNKANPGSNAPAESTSSKSVPIASRTIRSDSNHAEPPRADPVGSRQASVADSSSGLPVMATGPPTAGPSNDTVPEPNRKKQQRSPSNDISIVDGVSGTTHGHTNGSTPDPPSKMHAQDKLGKVASPSPPSITTTIPDAQGSPLSTVASPTTMGRPTYTRQQVGSSTFTNSFVVNVPGIWAIQVGKPSAGQTDVTFVVDHDTASSVHRWATHKQGFDPNARHVVVHLVALQTTAVSAAQHSLSQTPGGITPQAFALALCSIPPQWPEDDSLVLQLNAGQPREQTWFQTDMSGGMPLDVSSAICEGTNSLRILQLKNMANIVFAMYAAPPTPETLSTALEWEKFRKLYSFQRPTSGWSLG